MNTKKGDATVYAHAEIASIVAERAPTIDTSMMFDDMACEEKVSPIDQFIRNTEAINRIYLPIVYRAEQERKEVLHENGPTIAATRAGIPGSGSDHNSLAEKEASEEDRVRALDGADIILSGPLHPEPARVPPELCALVVLGYMSAVESYFRALLRNLIIVDEHVSYLVEPMTVSFGAARNHTPELLPEALTEHMSFAGEKNVIEILKNMIGIKGNVPSEVAASLKDFQKICEIRHCCVHRFGKLGSKTAIALGLGSHANYLEKPFAPTAVDLQNVSLSLRMFVNVINNFVFTSIIERVPDLGTQRAELRYRWSWVGAWEADKEKFEGYYLIFRSTLSKPPSKPVENMYESLQQLLSHQRAKNRSGRQKLELSAQKDTTSRN